MVGELKNWVKNYTNTLFRSLPLLWKAAPKEMMFLILAIFLQGLLPAISVWITKLIVDTIAMAVTSERALNSMMVGSLVAGWIGALLLQTLLNPWIAAIQGNLNDKLMAHVSLLLMRKANTFPGLSRFEDSKFYDELKILQEQIKYQPLNFLHSLVELGRSLITLLAMVVLLIPLGFWIPLVIAIATIPQIVVSFLYQKTIWLTLFQKSPQARRMEYCTSVVLSDAHAKEVRLFKLGSFFVDRYLQAFHSLHHAMRDLRSKQAFWSSSLAILSALGNGFAFYWVVQRAFKGELTSGSIILFIQSLAYFQQNLEGLLRTCLSLFQTVLYMQQFFNFLDSKIPMKLSLPGKKLSAKINSQISFENVSFNYPDGRLALENVSFNLYPGETVAIVGENGAGKTTLIKLLCRLYDPTQGRIAVDGVNLKDLNLDWWRKQIAGVFQDFGRYSLTIGENIALGNLEALDRQEWIESAIAKAGIVDLVNKFPSRTDTALGKQFDGTELSGGQWQKLALARAFVRQKAQFLILDEPTAALDPRSESKLYRDFIRLSRDKTTILITHRLASIRMADRILVLKDGRLIEDGTHEQLLNLKGEYNELWNMQAKQYDLSSVR